MLTYALLCWGSFFLFLICKCFYHEKVLNFVKCFFFIDKDNHRDFPCSSVGKESTCNAGDLDLIPGLGKSPGEGNGNPLQYSCLGNPVHRGVWRAIVHRVSRVGHDLVTKPPEIIMRSFHSSNVVSHLY